MVGEPDGIAVINTMFAVCIQFANPEIIGFSLFEIHHTGTGVPIGKVEPIIIRVRGFSIAG